MMEAPVHYEWIRGLFGGALIGLAVSAMLLLNGRVTGISGIVGGLLRPVRGDAMWRAFFIGGLVLGGFVLRATDARVFQGALNTSDATVVAAGVLVGFGTLLGSGCTSGHGICGISRLSPRSLLATTVFIAAGVASVAAARWGGLLP